MENRDAFLPDTGNQQEGQLRHHYRFVPDGVSYSFADIEGEESITPSHRSFQGR